MSDPRNIAHDKKVLQKKKHDGEKPVPDAVETVQPGKKPQLKHHHDHEDPATQRAEDALHEAEELRETVEAHDEKMDIHKHPSS